MEKCAVSTNSFSRQRSPGFTAHVTFVLHENQILPWDVYLHNTCLPSHRWFNRKHGFMSPVDYHGSSKVEGFCGTDVVKTAQLTLSISLSMVVHCSYTWENHMPTCMYFKLFNLQGTEDGQKLTSFSCSSVWWHDSRKQLNASWRHVRSCDRRMG